MSVESLKLPSLLAEIEAEVNAELKVVVPSLALPTVSTPPVGSLVIRLPNGEALLATPGVPSITTPSGTPAVRSSSSGA